MSTMSMKLVLFAAAGLFSISSAHAGHTRFSVGLAFGSYGSGVSLYASNARGGYGPDYRRYDGGYYGCRYGYPAPVVVAPYYPAPVVVRTAYCPPPVIVQEPCPEPVVQQVVVQQPTGHYEWREDQVYVPGEWRYESLGCYGVRKIWCPGYNKIVRTKVWVWDN